MKVQTNPVIVIYAALFVMFSIFNSCVNDDALTKATVETTQVTSIKPYTALCGGTILSDGGSDVTKCGVCWSTTPNPVIENDTTVNAVGTGTFTSQIKALSPSTTYYVRAYAVNKGGVGYGLQVSFTTPIGVTDIDGNVYSAVKIGNQVWMVDNLKTTKYNDGTPIPLVSGSTEWKNCTTAGYCFYNNDVSKKGAYGILYNWYTVNSGKLAPFGWHVPTDVEWTTLNSYLNSGGRGFVGNLSGYRFYDGTFERIGFNGYWWSSTESSSNQAWNRDLISEGGMSRGVNNKQFGFSVLCVQDI